MSISNDSCLQSTNNEKRDSEAYDGNDYEAKFHEIDKKLVEIESSIQNKVILSSIKM